LTLALIHYTEHRYDITHSYLRPAAGLAVDLEGRPGCDIVEAINGETSAGAGNSPNGYEFMEAGTLDSCRSKLPLR
jgi:hypothetical protein